MEGIDRTEVTVNRVLPVTANGCILARVIGGIQECDGVLLNLTPLRQNISYAGPLRSSLKLFLPAIKL